MKEHPIIYNTQMIRAYLDDKKTMTRRIIKPQPPSNADVFYWAAPEIKSGKAPEGCWYEDENGLKFNCNCPYGQVGDKLWVRETWCLVDDTEFGGEEWLDYKATPKYTDIAPAGWDEVAPDDRLLHWKPSIHMPRKFSRLTQTITDIKVERVQDISIDDALNEGIEYDVSKPYSDPYSQFIHLWDSINAKRDYSWESDPWLWVISYPKYSEEPTRSN